MIAMNRQDNLDPLKVLTSSEIATVLRTLWLRRKRVHPRQNSIIFRLATCVGLRASEIAGLTLEAVRTEPRKGSHVRVYSHTTKRRVARSVPLSLDAATLDDMIEWKAFRANEMGAKPGDPFVCILNRGKVGFSHKVRYGGAIDRFNVWERFRTAIKCLGPDRVKMLSVHCGRHSFASHALRSGRTIAEVRDWLGHRSIETTSIYLHTFPDEFEDIGDMFSFPIV
jgi:integrase